MKYYVKNGTIFNLENADESFTEISEVEAMRLIKTYEFKVCFLRYFVVRVW